MNLETASTQTQEDSSPKPRMPSILRAFSVVSGWTFASRLSGLIREILMAKLLGAGVYSDIYAYALKLPSFFRRFFAEGALSAVLIPHFTHIMASDPPERVRQFAHNMISVLASGLLVFVLIFELAMPLVDRCIAPGFVKNPEVFAMVVHYTRLLFPYIWLISMVAFMGGILNAMHRFAWSAAISIVVNLCMVASLVVSVLLGERIQPGGILHSLIVCSLLGGVLQCWILKRHCARHGMPLRLTRPRLTPEVKGILKAALPGFLGAGVTQINIFIDMAFASLLPFGSASYLNYADRLNQFPISLIGAALGTSLLPTLSHLWGTQQHSQALQTQSKALTFSFALTAPACVGLFLLAEPIISLIYGRDKFDAYAVLQTSLALQAFGVGIPFYVATKVFSAVFFSHKDTKTPMWITLAVVALNSTLNSLLIGPLAHRGIAFATSFSALANTVLSFSILKHRGWVDLPVRALKGMAKILMATLVMGGGLLWVLKATSLPHPTPFSTLGFVMLGVALYLVSIVLLRAHKMS